METAEQRAEYVERMLEALCSEPGPHPSGTRAYEQVALRIHADLESVLPDAFLDRYLDFWHVLPRPEIIYKGKQVAVDVAENCAGTSPEGFTGMIERIDGPVPYRIVDVATGETAACITVGKDVHAERGYLIGEEVLSLPRFVVGIGEVPFVDLLVAERAEVQVRLRVVYAPEVPTYNIIGAIPGECNDEILVMAHAFAGTRPRYTLTFAITGSEEYGLMGAKHYARRRQIEGTADRLKFVINSDSLTYGPNLWATTDDVELMEIVKGVHRDLASETEPIYSEAGCWMNDAACFKGVNPHIRGINLNSRGYETLAANHSPADDMANVPRDCVESAFLVLRALVGRLQDL